MQFAIIASAIIVSLAILFGLRQYLRSKERRAMIEKGLDPSLTEIYSKKDSSRFFLFAGVLLLGIAIGIITGIGLASLFKMHGETKEFIVLSVIIFTGISSFVCYYLSRDNNK